MMTPDEVQRLSDGLLKISAGLGAFGVAAALIMLGLVRITELIGWL